MDNTVSEFSYDPLGCLTRAHNSHAQLRFQYNPLGQVISESQDGAAVTHEYDALGRLTQHQAGLRGKAALLGRRYGYDATGKLAAVDDLRQGASRYLYDPADRLLQVKGLTPERFVHDPAGNLTEERRGKAGRLTTRYAYDSDNRLIRAETPDGVSQYRYDPLGRRIAKVTPEGETRFVYDGARLLQETRAEQCRTYLFEPGGFRPLACIDQAGGAASQVYYYHLDHLGTPRELTDAAGKIVWSARYRAYGSLALSDVADIDNPLRFQGQYFDAETGLHYNLHRYYDPQAGRFIHQDPIGLAGGVNLFQYAVNPVNWVDPLGLTGKDCSNGAKNVPERGYHKEVYANKPVKPQDAVDKWDEFLGPEPHTNIHPRTGFPDDDRIVSADGKRSIRYGPHEMESTPTKHHYHEEIWTLDPEKNVMDVDNTVVRVPLPKK